VARGGLLRVLGVNEFAAVLWSALSGWRAWRSRTGSARRLGFERSMLGRRRRAARHRRALKYANHAMPDVFLTALFDDAAATGARGRESGSPGRGGRAHRSRRADEGALGLFPLIVIVAHAVWCRRLGRSWATGAWQAPLALLAVILPWYGYQLATHHDAFVREHIAWLLFQRGLGTGVEAASPWSPFGYVRELAITYWPWLPCAAFGLWLVARESFSRLTVYTSAAAMPREWRPRDGSRLLLVWPVVVLAVRPPRTSEAGYAMSVFPAFALLSARALGAWVQGERARTSVVLGGFALAAAAGAVLALTPFGTPPPRRPDIQALAEVARTNVGPDEAIVFAGGNYFAIAHQFVFYSDRLLQPGKGDAQAVRDAIDRHRWALVDTNRFARILRDDRARDLRVAWSGSWALVHAAPVPPVRVGPP
jgi:hypothetical protein